MGASMKDVAKLANVSTATVSHVMNKTRHVSEETRLNVLKAIEVLHYNVNPVARNLRSGSSHMIGFVVSNLANYFFLDIALSADEILSEAGYHLIYINSNEDHDKERENINRLVMQNVDGLIIAPVGDDCRYMEKMIGDKCPCVIFDRKPSGFERDLIMSTNKSGVMSGMENLIAKGYKRIGFVASRLDSTMEERIVGYKTALIKHNLPVDEDLIKLGSGQPRIMHQLKTGDNYQLAKYLVEERQADAIFCGNDLATVGVMSYLKENNCFIPNDVAMVSFDDLFWFSMACPDITAVDQDRPALGHKIAEVILSRIKGNKDEYREYRIPTNFIERSSC